MIEIQDNFQSSQNTGGNCHFTGNTGITGFRATPDIHSLSCDSQDTKHAQFTVVIKRKSSLGNFLLLGYHNKY